MRSKHASTLLIITASTGAFAAVANYGQCGGIGWTGETTCNSNWICYPYNPYFSQCIPAVSTKGPSTMAPSSTTTSTPIPPPTPIATTSGRPTSSCPTQTSYAVKPRATGLPIRALDGWAKNTYIQGSRTYGAVLGPAEFKSWFHTGSCISSIFSACSPYLVISAATTSYKPLSFDASCKTSGWSYGGDGTLIVNGTNTFIACDTGAVYFQTGNDLPAGNCTTTRLTTSLEL